MTDELRRSAVEAFGCPYRYKRIYLDGVDDTGDESLRGRAFHAAAWVYILRLAAKQVPADHEEARLAFAEGISVTGCPDHLVHHVDRLFFRWAEHFELDLQAYFAAEALVKRGRRTFRPDLVYIRPAEVEIVDFKTYYKGLTETQAKQELQLRWYLVEAVQAWPGFSRYRFTFVFVRLGYSVSLSFTADEIEAFAPGVQGAIDAVEQAEARGDFPAMPGSHCSLCRLACPVVDDPGRVPVRILSRQQAEDAFGQVLALEQRLKFLKKALAGWCYQEGPLVFRGQEYAHRGTTSRRFRLSDVIDHLPSTDSQQLITVSSTALKPVWKRTVLIPLDLLKKSMDTTRWGFRHKKAGEMPPADTVDVLAESEGEDEDGDD